MRTQLTAALKPLVDRLSQASYWIKTADGPRHVSRGFNATLFSEHVMGVNVYGLAQIKPGESTTRVAILDFDSHQGETAFDDMLNVVEPIANRLGKGGYHPTLFRSGGGKGVHLYLLWDTAQDAYSVREMLAETIDLFGYRNGTGGVARKMIEVFPKASYVPEGGFGNMVYLPLGNLSAPLGVE